MTRNIDDGFDSEIVENDAAFIFDETKQSQ
jgi:hypothetical protein